MADLRGKIFSALTGRPADVSGRTTGDVAGMLMAIGGPSNRTRSGIDLTRAAKVLGVSRRTAERWVATARTGTGQRPSPQRLKDLATRSRQAASTKRGRQAALAGSPVRQALTSRGGRLFITALQGPPPSGPRETKRNRVTDLALDPDEAAAMIDAWEKGGEQGFMSWATTKWDEDYLNDWEFARVDNIELRQ